MPITFDIDPERRLLEVQLSGELTTAEVREAVDRIVWHPRFGGTQHILSDHRELHQAATLDQVDAVLEHMLSYGETFQLLRWAIVTRLPDSYGMMRVLSALAELRNGMEVGVFTEEDPARRWLLEPAPSQRPT